MIRINLLSGEEGRKRSETFTFAKAKIIPLSTLAVVVVGCLSTMTIQNAKLSAVEQEVASARAQSEQYKKTIALINEMVQKQQELDRRLGLVRQLDETRFRTVAILDEMARRVPRYLWLTSLKNLSPERLAIDGYAFSNLVVSDLMSRLEESAVFGDVELTSVKRRVVEGQTAVNFTVTSSVAAAAGES